jgi:hypothetical protein
MTSDTRLIAEQLKNAPEAAEKIINAVLVANGGRTATYIQNAVSDDEYLMPFFRALGLKVNIIEPGNPDSYYLLALKTLRGASDKKLAEWLGMTHTQEWSNYWIPRTTVRIRVKSPSISVTLFTQLAAFPEEAVLMVDNARRLGRHWQEIWNQATSNLRKLRFDVTIDHDQGQFVRFQRVVAGDAAYVQQHREAYLNDVINMLDDTDPAAQKIHRLFNAKRDRKKEALLAEELRLFYILQLNQEVSNGFDGILGRLK